MRKISQKTVKEKIVKRKTVKRKTVKKKTVKGKTLPNITVNLQPSVFLNAEHQTALVSYCKNITI